MQVDSLYVIDVFFCAVAGMSHIADHIAGRDDIPLLQAFRIGIVLPQVCVVIVSFFVKTADADAPSPVLVPSKRFYIAGFGSDDRRADQNKKQNLRIKK